MSARLLAALVCLLYFGPRIGRADPVIPPDHKVVLYLRSQGPAGDPIVTAMQQELATQLKAARYNVEWRAIGTPSTATDDGLVAVVELRGACRPLPPGTAGTPVVNGESLASTAVQDGQVMPFSWIYCETLSNFLAPALAPIKTAQRDFLYGRAMGRVLAHELYHVLANELEHDRGGVAKSSFSAGEVLADSFSLGKSAVLRMHQPEPDDPDSAESALGR